MNVHMLVQKYENDLMTTYFDGNCESVKSPTVINRLVQQAFMNTGGISYIINYSALRIFMNMCMQVCIYIRTLYVFLNALTCI